MSDEAPEYDPMTADDARLLFVAVIKQARDDACAPPCSGKSKGSRRELMEQRAAKSWFTNGSNDFRFVCAMAGVEPEHLRDLFLSGRMQKVSPYSPKLGTRKERKIAV